MSSKTVTVLGSTGSVGKSTLDLLDFHKDKFKIKALTAFKNADLLIEQALKFKPDIAIIGDSHFYEQVKNALKPSGIEALCGEEGLLTAASCNVDISIAAIAGMQGLKPALATLGNAKILAIANKEPLVAAGRIFLDMAKTKGTKILPLDSEHNAIFQVFEDRNKDAVERLILTASGGPFRTWSYDQTRTATVEQALKHPNWSMGAKISIDSATLMNKGLEVIEAHYLFDMPHYKIDVLIHPQSVVHSMVEYSDGSVLAQMGAPDMRTPIAYALGWPERIETSGHKLDFGSFKNLEFYEPDLTQFQCLALAYEALGTGPEACIALNAANEVAVAAFLEKHICFLDIPDLVAKTLDGDYPALSDSIDDVIDYDLSIRRKTEILIAEM